MTDMLKSAREIIAELNRLENKPTKTLIHGIGRIQNVSYNGYFWHFKIRLNDEILINCEAGDPQDDNDIYFEEGDVIEFFGVILAYWTGTFCRYNVSKILIDDVKLSCEERYFSEVFMWNVKTYNRSVSGKVAITKKNCGMTDSEIACISELEDTENKWTYGHLIKRDNDVILHLDKVIE